MSSRGRERNNEASGHVREIQRFRRNPYISRPLPTEDSTVARRDPGDEDLNWDRLDQKVPDSERILLYFLALTFLYGAASQCPSSNACGFARRYLS